MRRLALSLVLSIVLCGAALADTLLVNGRIYTMNPESPTANAMVWDDAGTLLAVGEQRDLAYKYADAEVVDAGGAAVIPGLVDAHGHLLGLGMSLMQADLVGTHSEAEVIARLKAFAQTLPEGAWLIGNGWDQNDWPKKAFPTAARLDAAFPDRPVFLDRIDGHAAWVNSAAMAKALKPLDGDWQPDGGRILRVDGKATGILVDGAAGLVSGAIPDPGKQQIRMAYHKAFAKAVSHGLTGVHDAGVSLASFRVMQAMNAAGELPLRVYAMANGNHAALDWLCEQGGRWSSANHRLLMGAVKLYIDGALGSRGAALLQDYSDDPGNRGILVTSPEDLKTAVAKAHDCHVQVATHAIGDRGNRIVLDTYAEVLGDEIDSDHRWRIEHAQIVALEDIPRLAELHLIASMQPTHATSDMPWADERLGDARLAGAYAWQRFLEIGVPLALGSDFPVEKVNPMLGLYAAITRQDLAGEPPGGWLPKQRLSRTEALAGFTHGAAYAAFMEDRIGTLKPGLQADFVILDADPMVVPTRTIANIKPHSTWVSGKAVYTAKSR